VAHAREALSSAYAFIDRQLAPYFERLMEHPSVALTIDQARPYFKFYPRRAGLPRRFFDPAID
jgi:hypothetical protein